MPTTQQILGGGRNLPKPPLPPPPAPAEPDPTYDGVQAAPAVGGQAQQGGQKTPPGGFESPLLEAGKAFIGSLYDSTVGGLIQQGKTVWANTDGGGNSTLGRLYTTGGTVIASVVGLLGLNDAVNEDDAVDGHKQSMGERVSDGLTGAISMATTVWGIKAAILPGVGASSAGSLAPNNANNAASYAKYKQGLAAEEAAANPGVTRNGRFADANKLQDHAGRHGADFGATTAAEYEQQANSFLNGTRGHGVLEKTRPNGDIVRYNDVTGEFGIVKPDGTIRTYYRPDTAVHGYPTNLDYFNAQ